MSRFHLLTFSIASVLLAGCASNSVFIMSDYKGKTLAGRHLAVVRFVPTILNTDDVADDLGAGVAEDVYLAYFSTEFSSAVKGYARFDSVTCLRTNPGLPTTVRELEMDGGERIRVSLPPEGSTVSFDSVSPDYLLFLGQFYVMRGAAQPGIYVPGPKGGAGSYSGGSFGDLSHRTQFVLWDNTVGRIISYGRVETKSEITFFAMTKGDWKGCVDKMAVEILKESPFKKPKRGW